MNGPRPGAEGRAALRGRLGVILSFSLVLFTVYQTLVLTDVTDDVIRLGIEGDKYEMLWASVASTCGFLIGAFGAVAMLGHRGGRITLAVGLAGFALGNLLCGMSTSLATMVVARLVEGIGKGVATVAGRTTLYKQFDRALLFAIGFYGVFAYSSRYITPMLAAEINEALGWRWIFWVNVPLSLAAMASVLATFRPDRPDPPKPARVSPAGLLGLGLVVGWFTCMIVAFGWYRRWGGWTSDRFVAVAILAGALPVALAAWLILSGGPGGHLRRLFSSRVYIASMLARGLMLTQMAVVLSMMGTYLVSGRGYTRPIAGRVMAPTAATMAATTALTVIFYRRRLRHVWMYVAVVGSPAALWWLATLDNFTPKGEVALILAVWGLAMGLFPPVFLADEVEGQNPKDAAFASAVSIVALFTLMTIVPDITKTNVQAWADRVEDSTRLDISPNRPAVERTAARVADYYARGGLTPEDARSATGRLIGEYVARESVIRGVRWGLQSFAIIMLALGLLVATTLARAADGLHAPPGSGYS